MRFAGEKEGRFPWIPGSTAGIGSTTEEGAAGAWGTERAVPKTVGSGCWLESTRGRGGVSAGLTDEVLSVGVESAEGMSTSDEGGTS